MKRLIFKKQTVPFILMGGFLVGIFGVALFSVYLNASRVTIVKSLPSFHKNLLASSLHQAHAQELSPKPTIIPTPLLTATPTLTPTPVYTGYCLTVPVLMFHHIEPMAQANAAGHASLTVDPSIFDQQIQYLSTRGYHSISASDLVHDLTSHTAAPSKSIVVSFDDGYADNYTYAFPILKKYGITGSLFLSTGLVGNPDYMSWGNAKEVSDSGTFHIYNHTWSHFALPRGDDTKINYEISTAKGQIQQYIGKSDDGTFAYPYGSNDAKSITALQKNGYTGAYSTIGGTMQCDSFVMALHRTRIGNAPLSSYGI